MERLAQSLATFLGFLAHVKTLPQDGTLTPFPVQWPYVDRLARAIEAHRLLIVLKSRQMLISWLMMAFAIYTAMRRPNQWIGVVSKREDDAKILLERAVTIYSNLPDWLRRPLHSEPSTTSMRFDNGSRLICLPSSPGIGRTYTFNVVILDEAAHLRYGPQMWSGLGPTIDQTGRAIWLSTPNGYDRLFSRKWFEREQTYHHETVHWREHPHRDEAWRMEAARTLAEQGRDWDQEYELRFQAFAGLVFPDWSEENVIDPVMVPEWWTQVVGIDYGIDDRFAAAWEARTPQHRIVYDEYVGAHDSSFGWDIEQVKARSAGRPIHAFVIDPAATGRDMRSKMSLIAHIKRDHELDVCEGDRNPTVALNRLKEAVYSPATKERKLLVFRHCIHTIEAFKRVTWEMVRRGEKPHALDALRYAHTYDAPAGVQPPDPGQPRLRALPPHIDPNWDPMSVFLAQQTWYAEQEASGEGKLW